MTDTPRTDSQLLTVKDCSYVAPHPSGEYVHAEFARELERENAALKDCLDWAETILSNSLPMQHSTLDEWNEIINKWRDSKHTIDDARKEGQA